ncbi:hypothetical protein HCU64_09525 [Methylobacterium sp. C25]|uniref:hypothetical protein n=1 Tax=Methylobacterium sp. C25 TaxID=2721622 RepID=UPI001F2B0839|nr:hypothetical protein [Methylobacterium sp. C25]MCE4223990.1 hypothetical protein [Methylobacterium sp. C25]
MSSLLDVEWVLSTLFDASLFDFITAVLRGGFFLALVKPHDAKPHDHVLATGSRGTRAPD